MRSSRSASSWTTSSVPSADASSMTMHSKGTSHSGSSDSSVRWMVAAAFHDGTRTLTRGPPDSVVGGASSDRSDIAWMVSGGPRRAARGSAHRLVEVLFDVVVVRGLTDPAVVLAEDADDRPRIAILDLEEERGTTRRQVVADFLDELAIDAGRGRATDQAARDRPADDGTDREDDEQEAAQDRADRGAGLRTARHLVMERDLAVGVLAHDGRVLQPDLARVLDRPDRLQGRLGIVRAIKGDRQELRHRHDSSRSASVLPRGVSKPQDTPDGKAWTDLSDRPDRTRRDRAPVPGAARRARRAAGAGRCRRRSVVGGRRLARGGLRPPRRGDERGHGARRDRDGRGARPPRAGDQGDRRLTVAPRGAGVRQASVGGGHSVPAFREALTAIGSTGDPTAGRAVAGSAGTRRSRKGRARRRSNTSMDRRTAASTSG